MLSKLLDSDTQEKINQSLGTILFPFKCYLIFLLLLLIIISYTTYQIHFNLNKPI